MVDAVETGCWFLQDAGTRCGIVNGILHDSDGERKKRKKKKMKEKRAIFVRIHLIARSWYHIPRPLHPLAPPRPSHPSLSRARKRTAEAS
jgi:hypothetical protein